MEAHYIKKYGIRSGYHKGKRRWYVVCDGRSTDLHYAKPDFAMTKAKQFIMACYRPFTRSNGEQVTFEFVQSAA